MNLRLLTVLALLLPVDAAETFAQRPPPPLPGRAPAPLLFVRLLAPAGSKVTFFQGRVLGRTLPAPATVGLRPGYIYRVELSGIPGHPEVSLAPTLEVRNTLALPPGVLPANYPAPVTFTEEDLEAVLAGSMVTKVVYLEHPDKAQPVASSKDRILESTLAANQDLLGEARERGRPMIIVRVGHRVVSVDELAAESIPGTILFPGDRSIAMPRVPPPLAFDYVRFVDPIHGRKFPEEECLHDGGDRGPLAGFDREGNLRGLDPEDTIAEWTDGAGRKRLTPSNRVCLCVPRYALLRNELPIGKYDSIVRVDDTRLAQPQSMVQGRIPIVVAGQFDMLKGVHGRARPTTALIAEGPVVATQIEMIRGIVLEQGPFEALGTQKVQLIAEVEKLRMAHQIELVRSFSQVAGIRGFETVEGTAVVGRNEGSTELVRAIAEVRDITVCCNEAPIPPAQPLRLFKWADRQAAQVGDVVAFSMKYSNVGGRPITDVAVSDSLSPRLEYVPGSAKADRDAVFTIQPNEAGSAVLRWEISGTLQPGKSGIVRFQAKVR